MGQESYPNRFFEATNYISFYRGDIDPLHSHLDQIRYTIIVDCGSSGSRAHLFKWKKDPTTSHIHLIRDDTKSKHIEPGLSAFKDAPHMTSEYLKPIMNYITELVPRDKYQDTSIHFMATAGLRLLDDSTQRAILDVIDNDMKNVYNFPKSRSQVISGEQEAIYSWVSLNMNKNLRDSQYSRTYGMIEMGGASTQIAFELNPDIESAISNDLKGTKALQAFKNEQLELEIGHDNSVHLLTVTFLGLGVNSAREAAIDLYVRDHLEGTGQLEHVQVQSNFDQFEIALHDPCLPLGATETIDRPTAMLKSKKKTIGFVIKQSEQTFKVKLSGDGDFFNCINHLERVIKTAKKERLNCQANQNEACAMDLLGTNFVPYHVHPFIGLSEMFFTTNHMMKSAGRFNRSKILHETKRICGISFDNLHEIYIRNESPPVPSDRVLSECFKAAWLLTILHDNGLRMPSEYEKFQTVEELDGEEINWTTGAMLMEAALKE